MRRFSMKVGYDAELDPANWSGSDLRFAFKNMKPWRKQLAITKAQRVQRGNRAKIEQRRQRREAAEHEVGELVRKMATALQMALQQLNDIPAPSQYQQQINVRKLHNILVDLRTKCGVKFDDDDVEFNARMPLAPQQQTLSHAERMAEHRAYQEELRQLRLARARELGEKFANYRQRAANK